MPIAFGSKAETLERLAPVVRSAQVLPLIRLTAREWRERRPAVIERIRRVDWGAGPVIVRSSAMAEDRDGDSRAGEYLSVPDVVGEAAIAEAVDLVIASYDDFRPDDQVFLQPMLRGVSMSGVAFSRDPHTGAPYIVVNYDDSSGSTDAVTSGRSNDVKTFCCFKGSRVPPPAALARVVALVNELEELLGSDSIDVEFAVAGSGELFLLQVRRLTLAGHTSVSQERQRDALHELEAKVRQWMAPHPFLHGATTVFGVMPDWNPAEIIGVRPRPLALSLYKELITDNIWAYQRDNYGYRNLRSFPLMVSLCGMPYIDVRVDFNSFVPAAVEPNLAERLVDYYIARLVQSPSRHDKVEFEVVYSCYTLDLPDRLSELRSYGFGAADCSRLTDSLRTLTNRIIHGEKGLWRTDIDKIKILQARYDVTRASQMDDVSTIYWLLEDCKRYGTLPFAGLARAAFIAVQLLRSLVSVGVLAQGEYDAFMGSLDTVVSRMQHDFEGLGRVAFLERYGHLRPGTYDILCARYDEDPDRYFDWSNRPASSEENLHPPFALGIEQLKRTSRLLNEHRLEHDVLGLFDFIKSAIEGREYSKFVFTRNLSDALALFGRLGADHGFSVDDCSYADIHAVQRLYSSSDPAESILGRSIEEGRRSYALTRQLNLPPIVRKPEDVWAFHYPPSEPNFITLGSAAGHVVFAGDDRSRMRGGILMLPSADPGYDWIFSHGIAGFITKYGGANSHMAVRAAELGIPAVVGAGETLYAKSARGIRLELDCLNRHVRVLR